MEDKKKPSISDNTKSERMMKRNSLMEDEFDHFDPSELEDVDDDWRDVFDDDGPDNNLDGPGAQTLDPSVLMPPPADKKAMASIPSLSHMNSSKAGLDQGSKRRRRSAAQAEKGDTDWHSEAADLPHRQRMIQEIAQLLFERKKDNPGKEWLKRLPLKARMLETQLYKSATSLESYLAPGTLKVRLGQLASAITSHYKEAISSRRGSTQSSTSSIVSISSLGSLETRFSSANLRLPSRESALPSAHPVSKLRREQSESVVASSSMPASFMTKPRREKSDPVVPNNSIDGPSSASNSSIIALSANSAAPGNTNTLKNSPSRQNTAGPASNVNPRNPANNAMNPANSAQLQQQQLLANMRQQQIIARQMNMNGQQGNMMNPQMAMMGNNGMAMMNQLQQQQMMMQQQQQQNGGMQNMALLQQQQNAAMFMGNAGANNGLNMIMLPNVIPSVGGANFSGFNNSTNIILAQDNTNMPPPAAMNAANAPRRASGTNEEGGPLSPNSFRW